MQKAAVWLHTLLVAMLSFCCASGLPQHWGLRISMLLSRDMRAKHLERSIALIPRGGQGVLLHPGLHLGLQGLQLSHPVQAPLVALQPQSI